MSRLWKMAQGCFEIGGAFKYLSRVLELMCFIINGNAISIKANIGKGTIFHHHGVGCVVHDNAIIGDNCHIFQYIKYFVPADHVSIWSYSIISIVVSLVIGIPASIIWRKAKGDNSVPAPNTTIYKN